jgi:hypothetical protein
MPLGIFATEQRENQNLSHELREFHEFLGAHSRKFVKFAAKTSELFVHPVGNGRA